MSWATSSPKRRRGLRAFYARPVQDVREYRHQERGDRAAVGILPAPGTAPPAEQSTAHAQDAEAALHQRQGSAGSVLSHARRSSTSSTSCARPTATAPPRRPRPSWQPPCSWTTTSAESTTRPAARRCCPTRSRRPSSAYGGQVLYRHLVDEILIRDGPGLRRAPGRWPGDPGRSRRRQRHRVEHLRQAGAAGAHRPRAAGLGASLWCPPSPA